MVNIIKQEIEIEEALKNKIEFICSFCNTTPTIFYGSIRTIEHTNLTYVEPHRIIIKDKMFLAFNYETNIYIENLTNSIMINDLEDNQEKIEELETIKYEQKLRIDSLDATIKEKQDKIDKQKEDIKKLKQDKSELNDLINYWKNKFLEIIKLIKNKLFGKKEEREHYMNVANELYKKNIIDINQLDEMYDIYESSENYDNNRGKSDDFER